MRCVKCGNDYPSKYYFETETICKECYGKLNPEEKVAIPKIESEAKQTASESGFFSFQKMISVTLIKILYALGMIIIIIGGIVMIAQGSDTYRNGDALVIGGIALIIFGNIFWRIICEGWIIIFSLHETTASILKELKNK